jgi:hypothetical protein
MAKPATVRSATAAAVATITARRAAGVRVMRRRCDEMLSLMVRLLRWTVACKKYTEMFGREHERRMRHR